MLNYVPNIGNLSRVVEVTNNIISIFHWFEMKTSHLRNWRYFRSF